MKKRFLQIICFIMGQIEKMMCITTVHLQFNKLFIKPFYEIAGIHINFAENLTNLDEIQKIEKQIFIRPAFILMQQLFFIRCAFFSYSFLVIE